MNVRLRRLKTWPRPFIIPFLSHNFLSNQRQSNGKPLILFPPHFVCVIVAAVFNNMKSNRHIQVLHHECTKVRLIFYLNVNFLLAHLCPAMFHYRSAILIIACYRVITHTSAPTVITYDALARTVVVIERLIIR